MTDPTPALAENPPSPASGSRRLTIGVAVAAALAGAGAAWWRLLPGEVDSHTTSALWAEQFSTPTGQALPMANFQGRPLLLNFWATWCPPCVKELPLLNRFYQAQRSKGWQVLGLAIDQQASVAKFLQHTPLDFPLALGGASGLQWVRTLGNQAGGLPFSVLFAADGRILQRKIGELSSADLESWSRTL